MRTDGRTLDIEWKDFVESVLKVTEAAKTLREADEALKAKDAEIDALKFQLAEALEWKERWKEAAEMAKDLYRGKVGTK